jgi:archaellum component FlaC
MNEKNIYFAFIASAIIFFIVGRYSVSFSLFGRPATTNTDGGTGNAVTKSIDDSTKRAEELETRLERIHDRSELIEKQLIDSIEGIKTTIDNIEKLRIIFKVLEEVFSGLRDINSWSVGDFDSNYDKLTEEKE